MTINPPFTRISFVLMLSLLLMGCGTAARVSLPQKLSLPQTLTAGSEPESRFDEPRQNRMKWMPAAPLTGPNKPGHLVSPVVDGEQSANLTLNFEQVPLTTLIQVVYTEMLGRPVNIDPKVMERRDLVTFRTPERQSSTQVYAAMQLLLKSYGIVALDIGDLVRVVPDMAQVGHLPEIRRGAALPESPEILRPIFQLVELEAVRNTDVAGWIKNMFGSRVLVREDIVRNALMLSGTSDSVAAAIEAIRVLDQPVMRDRASLRITPMFWTADELTARLQEILAAEGYNMPPANYRVRGGGLRYPILLLPISSSNTILVFSRSEKILAHVQEWISELDQPNEQVPGKNFFTYTALNTTAGDLAETLNELFQTSTPASTGKQPSAAGGSDTGKQVVVDKGSNTLIFRTDSENYAQMIGLLRTLDVPSKSALIEVTVAELALTDDSQLGVEWLLKDAAANGAETIAQTLGGLSLGSAGLTISKINSAGDLRFIFNALASSNRATILSSPRIMARNGETATIQVGQEVPIITSQQSTVSASTTEGTGVLQTVQYRNTGVILTVKPVIHSNNRIDLEVMQEVSAAQSTVTGVDVSPTFKTRKIDTKLTLSSGSTVLLGGLISTDESEGIAGIPILKDLPFVGGLFRTNTDNVKKTEMIVLITPYILNSDGDALAVTEAFKSMLPFLEVSPDLSPLENSSRLETSDRMEAQ